MLGAAKTQKRKSGRATCYGILFKSRKGLYTNQWACKTRPVWLDSKLSIDFNTEKQVFLDILLQVPIREIKNSIVITQE